MNNSSSILFSFAKLEDGGLLSVGKGLSQMEAIEILDLNFSA